MLVQQPHASNSQTVSTGSVFDADQQALDSDLVNMALLHYSCHMWQLAMAHHKVRLRVRVRIWFGVSQMAILTMTTAMVNTVI